MSIRTDLLPHLLALRRSRCVVRGRPTSAGAAACRVPTRSDRPRPASASHSVRTRTSSSPCGSQGPVAGGAYFSSSSSSSSSESGQVLRSDGSISGGPAMRTTPLMGGDTPRGCYRFTDSGGAAPTRVAPQPRAGTVVGLLMANDTFREPFRLDHIRIGHNLVGRALNYVTFIAF